MDWPEDSDGSASLTLALQRALVSSFTEADWKELGYETGTIDWIERHERLLRSLSWGDDDYGAHVFDALKMLRQKNRGLDSLLKRGPIRRSLKKCS